MKDLIIALGIILVLAFASVWYLDTHWCGIAALGAQTCPGD
jgi:hypothetical protein